MMYMIATIFLCGLGAAALLGAAYAIEYAYEHNEHIKDLIDKIA